MGASPQTGISMEGEQIIDDGGFVKKIIQNLKTLIIFC
jgi:hypothetical protein